MKRTINPAQEYVRKILSETIPEGDFAITDVSEQVLEVLRRSDRKLLAEWLDSLALNWLHDSLATILRSRRSFFRRRVAQAARAEAVAAGMFEATYVVDRDYTCRYVRDMTGADHLFVANNYQMNAKQAALFAAFHEAVARKVGNNTTSDVFTEEQYAKMYQSIVSTNMKGAMSA